MADDYELKTNRPTHTKVGHVLFYEEDPWRPLLEVYRDNLDQEDGWAWFVGNRLHWLVGRLLLTVSVDAGSVRADIAVVGNASVTDDGLTLLDELNRSSAGWAWWIDGSTVRCGAVVPADAKQWWWLELLRDAVPRMAACAELAADDVAAAFGGAVIADEHPQRGRRPGVDGWVDGVVLGSRDLSASLDLFITGLEYGRAKAALDFLVGEDRAVVQTPLFVYAGLATDVSLVVSRVWHPLWGWGWLRTAVLEVGVGADVDLRPIAADLTSDAIRNPIGDAVIGAWSWVDGLGFAQVAFIPAMLAEQVVDQCDGTTGEVLALMAAAPDRRTAVMEALRSARADERVDEASSYLDLDELKFGIWSIQLRTYRSVAEPALAADPEWLTPKHELVCSMGIFNPSGPTIASLEVSWGSEGDWELFYILRHTILPRIVSLGTGTGDVALGSAITTAFAERYEETLGWGLDWLDIQTRGDAVVSGMEGFAATVDPADLARRTASLRRDPDDPWSRLTNERDNPIESADFTIGDWIDTITHPLVIAGHQLFIRSAWEGGLVWARTSGDPAGSQGAADEVTTRRRQRALDDWYYRQQQGPLVHPPGIE